MYFHIHQNDLKLYNLILANYCNILFVPFFAENEEESAFLPAQDPYIFNVRGRKVSILLNENAYCQSSFSFRAPSLAKLV